jgi:general secretion pathway protein G
VKRVENNPLCPPYFKGEIKRFKGLSTMLKNRGFTLTELIIVIVLLGILSVVAIPRMGGIAERARITTTQGEMRILRDALSGEEGFLTHVGRLPTTAEGLPALITVPTGVSPWDRWTERGWRGPYVEANGDAYRQDAWGRLYVYEQLAPTRGRLISHGPDGAPGGGDDIVIEFGH